MIKDFSNQLIQKFPYLQTETILSIVENTNKLFQQLQTEITKETYELLSEIRICIALQQQENSKLSMILNLYFSKSSVKTILSTIIENYLSFGKKEKDMKKYFEIVDDVLFYLQFNLSQIQISKTSSEKHKIENEIKKYFEEFMKLKHNADLVDIILPNEMNGNKSLKLISQYTNQHEYQFIRMIVLLLLKVKDQFNLKSPRSPRNNQMKKQAKSSYITEGYYYNEIEDMRNLEINERISNEYEQILDCILNFIGSNDCQIDKTLTKYSNELKSIYLKQKTILKNNEIDEKKKQEKIEELKEIVKQMKRFDENEFQKIEKNPQDYFIKIRISFIERQLMEIKNERQTIQNEFDSVNIEIPQIETKIKENDSTTITLKENIIENGIYDKLIEKEESEKVQLRERVAQEDAQHLQYINIPFENWYLERKHRVFIRLDDNRRLTCTIDITHQRKNGEIVKINDNIQLVLNFTHRYYRREGDDIIYYMRENEIHKEYRDSVRHPNGSSFGYSYNDFKNNEIIVEGFGFRDQNGKSGRFIIRKIGENQEIPTKEHAIISHRQENADQLASHNNKIKEIQQQKKDDANTIKTLQKEKKEMEKQLESLHKSHKQLTEKLEQFDNSINDLEMKMEKQKETDKNDHYEEIIKTAQEENRIIEFTGKKLTDGQLIQSKEEEHLFCFKIQDIFHEVYTNKNMKTIEKGVFNGNSIISHIQLISSEMIDPTKEYYQFGNTQTVLKYLNENQRILVFNVEKIDNYSFDYYPYIPCSRSVFGLKDSYPLIFPIKITEGNQQFIFANEFYDDKYRHLNGIIVINYYDDITLLKDLSMKPIPTKDEIKLPIEITHQPQPNEKKHHSHKEKKATQTYLNQPQRQNSNKQIEVNSVKIEKEIPKDEQIIEDQQKRKPKKESSKKDLKNENIKIISEKEFLWRYSSLPEGSKYSLLKNAKKEMFGIELVKGQWNSTMKHLTTNKLIVSEKEVTIPTEYISIIDETNFENKFVEQMIQKQKPIKYYRTKKSIIEYLTKKSSHHEIIGGITIGKRNEFDLGDEDQVFILPIPSSIPQSNRVVYQFSRHSKYIVLEIIE